MEREKYQNKKQFVRSFFLSSIAVNLMIKERVVESLSGASV